MGRRAVIFALAVALLAGGRAAPSLLARSAEAHPLVWHGMQACTPGNRGPGQWRPKVVNADHEIALNLSCEGGLLGVHVAQYFSQEPGKEAVGGANQVADVAHPGDLVTRAVDSGIGFTVNETRLGDTRGQAVLIWHWYGIGSDAFASERRAKLAEARQVLMLRPTVSTVFMVAAIGVAEPADRALLRQAARSLWSTYLEQLDQ